MNNQISSHNHSVKFEINTIEYWLQKAQDYLELESFTSAISCYQKIVQIAPECWQAYHYWGDCLLNLERYEEAIALYHRALKINPNFDWSYYNLGETLTKLKRWQEAIDAYNHVLKINPNLPHLYRKLGDAMQGRADDDRIALLAFYQQEIDANPDRLQNYYQALELQPQDLQLYFGLGNALIKQNKLDEAIVTYQMALQIEPKHPQITQQLNNLLKKKDIFERTTNGSYFFDSIDRLEISKQVLANLTKVALENFLLSGTKIELPALENPELSIILVLYNRAELTLSCLESILKNNFKSYQVIIVDNASDDRTQLLLDRIENAIIIRNSENLHFLHAANQASQAATGKYLLFLNNDAQILADSINAAIKTIESALDIGAVGGKIILPDGTLQEAGSIIWQDGSCLGYGRGDSPYAPQYMFRRSVDYCSGAFLLTSRELFLQLGGFDPAYQPAYYEETDYCVKLLKAGKKIIYEPDVSILHYEFASSSSSDRAIELQTRNRHIFISKHQDWLHYQYASDLNNFLLARSVKDNRQRILFIDDRVPHPYLGSGYTRSHVILNHMVNLGYFVTFYPSDLSHQENWIDIYADIPREVEVATGYGLPGLEEFLKARKGYYDLVFVSRPHNMSQINYLLSRENLLAGTKIIYDAEALYCLREFEQKKLLGIQLNSEDLQRAIDEEIELAKHSDAIVSVSESEKQYFLDRGYKQVRAIGHSLEIIPTSNHCQQRQHLLFVGSVYKSESPNADSITWLTEAIFPAIASNLNESVNLLIAGNNTVAEIKQQVANLNNPAISMLGKVDNLTQLYNQARIFVAPTRFAAGIPHKVHEAAANGLPIVTTSLIANQLGWKHESELLVADNTVEFAKQCIRLYQDPQLWQQLRDNALKRVERECSPENFRAALGQILRTGSREQAAGSR
jgi:GT2 family glycosyltransferase/cytochrome c-type biogenesis protein CcmH/NrfG